ncbi:MAG: hypothetical protein WA604_23080 [Candidatus Sulfotelmatobacter sp.]
MSAEPRLRVRISAHAIRLKYILAARHDTLVFIMPQVPAVILPQDKAVFTKTLS